MRYDFILKKTDCSFCCGDFPNSTYIEIEEHGFSIEIDSVDNIDLYSIESFGDFSVELSKIDKLEDLLNFINKNIENVEDYNTILSLKELIEFIKCQIKREKDIKKENEERKVA